MLNIDKTALVIIDVQEKLSRAMHEKDKLFDSLQRLIEGARILDIPIVLTEQNPNGLGPTAPELALLLAGVEPITKFSFSCCGEDGFNDALATLGRRQILLTGIEAHVCVYQTAVDLIDAGYEAHVVIDCIDSRTPENKALALDKMKHAGAEITSVEIALFELLKTAADPKFKGISKIVK
ncbi:MAG: hydrolase [Chloroflexota bacterium]|nr:hydrolase [Chloroflexota bacterium]